MKEVVAAISGIDRDIQDVDESIEAFMQESANVLDYSGGMQTRVGEAGKGFADKTDNLKIVINKLTQAVSNISTVIEDSARGIENAANETSVLAEEMQNINNDISDSMHVVNDMEQPCNKSSNV